MGLGLLLLVLLAVGVVLLVIAYVWRPGPGPVPGTAVAPALSCDVSAELAALQRPGALAAVTLVPRNNGGTIVGDTIALPAGTRIQANRDLTLVARGDIVIDGRLDVRTRPGRPFTRVTLVSRSGEVRIGRTGSINGSAFPFALAGPAPGPGVRRTGRHAVAGGLAGRSGGVIRLSGVIVTIEGIVIGNDGQPAGAADADASRSARAAGGQGGFGGSVLICAEEAINVARSTFVTGGDGGAGGDAIAQSGDGEPAGALGGLGGPGGDVVFQGTGGGPVPLFSVGPVGGFLVGVTGGSGGEGGTATASARPASAGRGGRAEARGGTGGMGGTVRFVNCEVVPPVGLRFVAGGGAAGGPATALGGRGADGIRRGANGGTGAATGGRGGDTGLLPAYALRGGGSGTGSFSLVGGGGEADAQGGPGGNATAPAGGRGGVSGVSSATGGLAADGLAPIPPASGANPVAGAGRQGGRAPRVMNPGAP